MRYFVSRCFSLDTFLDLIASPSDTPGELIRTSFPSWKETGLRYHRPSTRASIGQILISTVIGFAVAHTLPMGQHLSSDPLVKLVLIATCAQTVLTNLVFLALDGTSHELDPKLYQSLKPHQILSFRSVPLIVSTCVMVPAISVGVATRIDYEDVGFMSSMEIWALALVVTALMSIYLVLVNEASKRTLCMPGMNLERLVEELSDDAPRETTLHVMVESILEGSDSLVRSVFQPTQKVGVLYAEDEELKRGDKSMGQMAQVLLGMDRHADSSQACLERDMLLVYILESLGGTDETEGAKPCELGNASTRHVQAIKKWAHPQNAVWVGAPRREPDAVPLLRALCAYAAGLGEALRICTLPPNAPQRLALDGTSSLTTFSIPPGGRACSEWAMRAAARLIVYSITSSKDPSADWRSSSLSVLVPVMLQAAFHLRKGALQFARMSHGKHTLTAKANAMEFISGGNEYLRPVVLACEEAALMVVEALKCSEGVNRVNTQMSNECRLWLVELGAIAS